MKSLLLVEDDEHKRDALSEFLKESFTEVEVTYAASLMSGVRKARKTEHSVILLDMTLPNYDLRDGETGAGMHAFGGVEFLKQMKRHKVFTPVIVITQFETFGQPPNVKDLAELNDEMIDAFSPVYRGAIYYHASIEDWSRSLDTMLREVL